MVESPLYIQKQYWSDPVIVFVLLDIVKEQEGRVDCRPLFAAAELRVIEQVAYISQMAKASGVDLF